jgi:branched-chain amino acid transport system substrate-binding protein
LKKLIALLLVLLMALAAVACTATPAPEAPTSAPPVETSADTGDDKEEETPAADNKYDQSDKIIIGCVTSLTGERAQNGVYTKEALDMLQEELAAEGGVLGKEVEFVFEDDQSTDQGGANAYQKLMSRGDVNATVVSLYSSIALALEPYVKQYEIPTFTGGSSVKFAEIGNPFMWQIRYNDLLAGSTMATAAIDTLGMTKPAIIHESDSFGQGLADASKAKLIELGIAEGDIKMLTYNKGEKNFSPFTAQIKEAGCDGIIAVSQQIEASLIMMQVQAAGLNIPCIGSTSYCSEIAINNAEDAAEGWYSVSDWSPTVETENGKAFVERYRAKYNKDPDLPSSTMYDSALVLIEAMKAGNSVEPKTINENLAKIDGFEGVAATYAPNEDRICAKTQFLTKNVDGKPAIQDIISR